MFPNIQYCSTFNIWLFNISTCGIFLQIYDVDIASYADDNTFCTYETELNIIRKLLDCTIKPFKWFGENHLKDNGEKYHVRKDIFACLFSIDNTISYHVMNKYV